MTSAEIGYTRLPTAPHGGQLESVWKLRGCGFIVYPAHCTQPWAHCKPTVFSGQLSFLPSV